MWSAHRHVWKNNGLKNKRDTVRWVKPVQGDSPTQQQHTQNVPWVAQFVLETDLCVTCFTQRTEQKSIGRCVRLLRFRNRLKRTKATSNSKTPDEQRSPMARATKAPAECFNLFAPRPSWDLDVSHRISFHSNCFCHFRRRPACSAASILQKRCEERWTASFETNKSIWSDKSTVASDKKIDKHLISLVHALTFCWTCGHTESFCLLPLRSWI